MKSKSFSSAEGPPTLAATAKLCWTFLLVGGLKRNYSFFSAQNLQMLCISYFFYCPGWPMQSGASYESNDPLGTDVSLFSNILPGFDFPPFNTFRLVKTSKMSGRAWPNEVDWRKWISMLGRGQLQHLPKLFL